MANFVTCPPPDPSLLVGELDLPSNDPEQWSFIEQVLNEPYTLSNMPSCLDNIITNFATKDSERRTCTFFQEVPNSAEDNTKMSFDHFFLETVPFIIQAALDMPLLFPPSAPVPIFKSKSAMIPSPSGAPKLNELTFSLTRRQCTCLLAHSFFGSLKRPPSVQLNDFRFTVVDLFLGTARSPNSAITFLNYFVQLSKQGRDKKEGEKEGGPRQEDDREDDKEEEELIQFIRRGYAKGALPWTWENNPKPLCKVHLVRGNINDCTEADLHAEFANAFVGGGVMTGDAAQEETLFLVKPELMVAMAVQNRMFDQESILVRNAIQYSVTEGFKQDFSFAGPCLLRPPAGPATICAMDAVRGGGPAMEMVSMLRDMNKARVAFEGAKAVATGHWGCGAYGNHHDLMFLKQWLAASEAGVSVLYYHDFSHKQSHFIFPLVRRLKHFNVGELWRYLQDLTSDLRPCKMGLFSQRVADISTGKLKVDGHGGGGGGGGETKSGDFAGSAVDRASVETSVETSVEATENSAPCPPLAVDPLVVYSLEQLQHGAPSGVNPAEKEHYLSSVDFAFCFNMTRDAFSNLPAWKRNSAKKKNGLF